MGPLTALEKKKEESAMVFVLFVAHRSFRVYVSTSHRSERVLCHSSNLPGMPKQCRPILLFIMAMIF